MRSPSRTRGTGSSSHASIRAARTTPETPERFAPSSHRSPKDGNRCNRWANTEHIYRCFRGVYAERDGPIENTRTAAGAMPRLGGPVLVPCAKCGEPIDVDKPHWSEARQAWHFGCVGWASRRPPFEADLWWLENRYREAKRRLDVIVHEGKWLRAAIKRWPVGAAEAVASWVFMRARVERVWDPSPPRMRRDER